MMYIFFLMHLGAHTIFLDHLWESKQKIEKFHALRALDLQRWTFNHSKEGNSPGNLRGTCALTPENTIAALKSRFRRENSKKLLEKFSRPAGAMTKSKKRIDLEEEGGFVSCSSEGKRGEDKKLYDIQTQARGETISQTTNGNRRTMPSKRSLQRWIVPHLAPLHADRGGAQPDE